VDCFTSLSIDERLQHFFIQKKKLGMERDYLELKEGSLNVA
jgi:hypothetical protein